MFYVIRYDTKYYVTRYLTWKNLGELDFVTDSPHLWVKDESFKFIVSLEEGEEEKLSDFFYCGKLDIVSQEFKSVLCEFSKKIEFVPVFISCGDLSFDYYALHVLNIVDALDREKSKFSGIKYGMVAGITHLVLNYSMVAHEDIFFLKDTFCSLLVVSEKVRKRIMESELQGMEFVPLDMYVEDTGEI